MTTQGNKKSENLSLEVTIAMLVSLAATFVLPMLVNAGLGKDVKYMALYVIAFLAICIGVVCMITFLSKEMRGADSPAKSYMSIVGRVLLMLLVLLGVSVIFSLLSGVLAVVLYAVLKEVLTLGQIKGIIDLLISGILLLTAPYFITVFWKTLAQKDKIAKVVTESLHMKGKVYVRLLVLTVILFAVGLLVTTPFHYLPNNVLTMLIQAIVLGGIGAVALETSRRMVA